jgi:hypothetical protein
VVVATGYEHTPIIPEWPGKDSSTGELLHSSTYRNPIPLRGKRVLVVGAGSSGIEIVVLEKQEYSDPGERARPEYRLTAAGFDLCVVLGALQLWGDTYLQLPGGPVTAPASATPVNPSAWHSSTTPGHQSTRIRSGSTGPLPATPARLAFVSAQRKWIAPTAKRESLAK